MTDFVIAREGFFSNGNESTYKRMAESFKMLVDKGTWVIFPCRESGKDFIHASIEKRGKMFIVMITSEEMVKHESDINIVITEIKE